MMPIFYESGPSGAPQWRTLERDFRRLAMVNNALRWMLPVWCAGVLFNAQHYAEMSNGGLLMGAMFFVSFFAARIVWRESSEVLAKCEAEERECGEIAADMELGLWPARWAHYLAEIPRDAMWRAIQRERGE